MKRRNSKVVEIGNVKIGGSNPIAIQSMNNTDTSDCGATLKQIRELADAGCDITRVAVLDFEAAQALKTICRQSPIPVVADIHFDYRLALEAIKNDAHKIRINPGNIGGKDKLKQVINAAKSFGIPIRVGVNSGSIEKKHLEKWGGVNEKSMCESLMETLKTMEECCFDNIVVSVKSSDTLLTIESCRLIAKKIPYPLHIGITEAGTYEEGIIKSAVGTGALLAEGIGDTIRISLTGDPVKEVEAAIRILRSLGLRKKGLEIISCPTCGRTAVDLEKTVRELEKKLPPVDFHVKIAVMGCAVNGPGEAKEADLGIAGGKNEFLLFAKGKIIKKISEREAPAELAKYLDVIINEKRRGESS